MAELLSYRLDNINFEKVFCSKLNRAIETVKIICKYSSIKDSLIEYKEELNERNCGVLAGRPKLEYNKELALSNKKQRYFEPENGESWHNVYLRAKNFIKNITTKYICESFVEPCKDSKILTNYTKTNNKLGANNGINKVPTFYNKTKIKSASLYKDNILYNKQTSVPSSYINKNTFINNIQIYLNNSNTENSIYFSKSNTNNNDITLNKGIIEESFSDIPSDNFDKLSINSSIKLKDYSNKSVSLCKYDYNLENLYKNKTRLISTKDSKIKVKFEYFFVNKGIDLIKSSSKYMSVVLNKYKGFDTNNKLSRILVITHSGFIKEFLNNIREKKYISHNYSQNTKLTGVYVIKIYCRHCGGKCNYDKTKSICNSNNCKLEYDIILYNSTNHLGKLIDVYD